MRKSTKTKKRLLLTAERIRDLRPLVTETLGQVVGGGSCTFTKVEEEDDGA